MCRYGNRPSPRLDESPGPAASGALPIVSHRGPALVSLLTWGIVGTGLMRERFDFLDGLRGWAALIVMMLHIFWEAFPATNFEPYNFPLWWPFSGTFAVCVFFLVSGFALSIAFVRTGDRLVLVRIAAGRYFRLAIPVFALCAGITALLNIGAILPPGERMVPFDSIYNFEPSIANLLRFSLFDVFFDYEHAETYAGPLWTMSIELIGSFIILALLMIIRREGWRWFVYAGLTAAFLYFESFYALFVIGVVLAELRHAHGTPVPLWLGPALLVLGPAIPHLTDRGRLSIIVGAAVFCAGAMATPRALAFLANPVSRWLGKISFPLYLVHSPVMFAVGMPLYMISDRNPWLYLLTDIVTAVASVAVALAFAPANDLAISASRRAGTLAVDLVRAARRSPASPAKVPTT
jgi:peptidoglycan/LPS O-acetylase OafA/YrhL